PGQRPPGHPAGVGRRTPGRAPRGPTPHTRPVPPPEERTPPLLLREASRRPSGAKATPVTAPVCPCRIAKSCRPVARHTRTVRSVPAEATHCPSALYTAVTVSPVWRATRASHSPPGAPAPHGPAPP